MFGIKSLFYGIILATIAQSACSMESLEKDKNIECTCDNQKPSTTLDKAVEFGCLACCIECITLGQDPNQASPYGVTPMHMATYNNRKEIVELFLNNGGDPLKVDSWGDTSLHWAADGCSQSTAELIIQWPDLQASLLTQENGYAKKITVVPMSPKLKKRIFTFFLALKHTQIVIPKALLYKIILWCNNPYLVDMVFTNDSTIQAKEQIEALTTKKNKKNQISYNLANEFRDQCSIKHIVDPKRKRGEGHHPKDK